MHAGEHVAPVEEAGRAEHAPHLDTRVVGYEAEELIDQLGRRFAPLHRASCRSLDAYDERVRPKGQAATQSPQVWAPRRPANPCGTRRRRRRTAGRGPCRPARPSRPARRTGVEAGAAAAAAPSVTGTPTVRSRSVNTVARRTLGPASGDTNSAVLPIQPRPARVAAVLWAKTPAASQSPDSGAELVDRGGGGDRLAAAFAQSRDQRVDGRVEQRRSGAGTRLGRRWRRPVRAWPVRAGRCARRARSRSAARGREPWRGRLRPRPTGRCRRGSAPRRRTSGCQTARRPAWTPLPRPRPVYHRRTSPGGPRTLSGWRVAPWVLNQDSNYPLLNGGSTWATSWPPASSRAVAATSAGKTALDTLDADGPQSPAHWPALRRGRKCSS